MRSYLLLLLSACSIQDITFHEPGAGGDDAPDVTAPSIESRVPDVDATDVEPSTEVTVTFDEPITADAALTVIDSKGDIAGTVEIVDRTLAFRPTKRLRNPESVTVSLSGVRDAAGNAMADASWTFTTRPKAWQTPVLVENQADSVELASYDLAMAGDGTAIAIYSLNTATGRELFSVTYAPDTGWSPPVPVETTQVAGNASNPNICIDAGGNALAVWTQSSGSTSLLYRNRYITGTGWEAPSHFGAPGGTTSLGCRPSGAGIVAWKDSSSTLQTATFTPTTGWSAVTTTPNVESSPTITTYGVGDGFYTSWIVNGITAKVRVGLFDMTWLMSDTETPGFSLRESVTAGLIGGGLLTVYTGFNTTRALLNGTTHILHNGEAARTLIASGPSGNAAVAYSPSDDLVLQLRRWDGTTWTPASSPGPGFRLPLTSAFLPDGTVLVGTYDANARSEVHTVHASGTWDAPILLNRPDSIRAYVSKIGSDADGNAIALFASETTTRTDLYALHYN